MHQSHIHLGHDFKLPMLSDVLYSIQALMNGTTEEPLNNNSLTHSVRKFEYYIVTKQFYQKYKEDLVDSIKSQESKADQKSQTC